QREECDPDAGQDCEAGRKTPQYGCDSHEGCSFARNLLDDEAARGKCQENCRAETKSRPVVERAVPVDPKAELQAMLESVAESTLDRIDQSGWATPVCLAHTHAGENFYVLYDDSEADDNDPYDHQAARESILRQVRAYITEGRFRAIAFARVVHITVDSDKG